MTRNSVYLELTCKRAEWYILFNNGLYILNKYNYTFISGPIFLSRSHIRSRGLLASRSEPALIGRPALIRRSALLAFPLRRSAFSLGALAEPPVVSPLFARQVKVRHRRHECNAATAAA